MAFDSWRLREVARDVRSNPPWGHLPEVAAGSGRLWSRRPDQSDAWSVAIDVDRRVDVGPGRVVGVRFLKAVAKRSEDGAERRIDLVFRVRVEA